MVKENWKSQLKPQTSFFTTGFLRFFNLLVYIVSLQVVNGVCVIPKLDGHGSLLAERPLRTTAVWERCCEGSV